MISGACPEFQSNPSSACAVVDRPRPSSAFTNRSNFDFLRRTHSQQHPSLDSLREPRLVFQDAVAPKDMGYEIVREEGQSIEIIEAAMGLASEDARQIGRGDLSSLVEWNLEFFVRRHIPVEGHLGKGTHELFGGMRH